MKRRLLFFYFLFLLALFPLISQPRYLIKTGHTGSVSGLAYHPLSNVLVSTGKDGTLKIWDVTTQNPVYSERISSGTLQLLALHPQKTQYAAVCENSGTYTVTVRDWTDNRELFSFPLEKKPLFIEYSPLGTYLAVCVENWRSLLLYNAEDGTLLNYFSTGFGIVSFVTFSGKETTLMTYQPSGKIIYWELNSSKILKEMKVEAGVIPVTMTNDKRQLIGLTNNKIMLLDVLSGEESGSFTIAGLISAAAERQGKNIAAYCRPTGGTGIIRLLAMEGTSFKEISSAVVKGSSLVSALTVTKDKVYAGNNDGEIIKVEKNSSEIIIENTISTIFDLAFIKSTLALATDRYLFIMRSDFFDSRLDSSSSPPELMLLKVNNPFAGSPTGLYFQEKKGLYLWRLGDAAGMLSLLDPNSFMTKHQQIVPFQSSLLKLVVNPQYYVSIEKTGLCRIFNIDTDALQFQYSANGMNAAVFIPPAQLVCGKSRLSSYDSPLTVIDSTTGETTLLSEPANIIQDLIFDEKKNTLYYLGFEQKNGVPNTFIKLRNGKSLKNDTTLISKTGERVSSSIALDRETGKFYFSFGENLIYSWNGSTIEQLEPSPQHITRIFIFQNNVFGLNEDSSITVWNATTNKIILHFFLFKDFSWVIITQSGRFFGQGAIEKYLHVSETGSSEKELLERYRLDIKIVTRAKDLP
jgi:WD40 repeat protein